MLPIALSDCVTDHAQEFVSETIWIHLVLKFFIYRSG